jgi:hypothetical protein
MSEDSKPAETINTTDDPEAPNSAETKKQADVIPIHGDVVVPTPQPVFRISIRGRLEPGKNARHVEAGCAEAALELALKYDVQGIGEPILTWRGRHELVALDFDLPEGESAFRDVDIPGMFPSHVPQPIAAWVTHRGGLRVIFPSVDRRSALGLAGAWLLLAAPVPWPVEVKTDSRHPAGLRDGSSCGQVFTFVPSGHISPPRYEIHDADDYEDADVERWLEDRGLTMGRHGADHCPWNPKATSGNAPVEISAIGVRCYHCGRRAKWSELLGRHQVRQDPLFAAARACVHLAHQRLVILDQQPNFPEQLLPYAWEHILREVHADVLNAPDEKVRGEMEHRVCLASSKHYDIVRSSAGGWLDAKSLTNRKVSDKTFKGLPWVHASWMIDKAANSAPLEGFVPVQPLGPAQIVGPFVTAPTGSIFVRRERTESDPPPIDLSRAPSDHDVERAWDVVDAVLPGIHRGYHCTLILAILFGQRGVGTPPIVAVTGQGGSAKTAQVILAGGATGSPSVSFAFGSGDDTTRRLGLALEEGASLVYADEVGRIDGIFAKLEPILAANSILSYRPKYSNERRIPMRAAVCLLGSTLPEAIVRSPELARRSVGYRLLGAEKNWALHDPKTGLPLDMSQVRVIDGLRAALDVITAFVFHRVQALGPAGDWRKLAMDEFFAVPLPQLDLVDVDGAARRDAIRALYELYRTAADHQLYRGQGFVEWLLTEPPSRVAEHVAVLVDPDGDKARFKAETSDVERLNLAPILGFANPQLQLLVRRRGKVILKFVEISGLRGHGTPRHLLPPAGSVTVGSSAPTTKVTL